VPESCSTSAYVERETTFASRFVRPPRRSGWPYLGVEPTRRSTTALTLPVNRYRLHSKSRRERRRSHGGMESSAGRATLDP